MLNLQYKYIYIQYILPAGPTKTKQNKKKRCMSSAWQDEIPCDCEGSEEYESNNGWRLDAVGA